MIIAWVYCFLIEYLSIAFLVWLGKAIQGKRAVYAKKELERENFKDPLITGNIPYTYLHEVFHTDLHNILYNCWNSENTFDIFFVPDFTMSWEVKKKI